MHNFNLEVQKMSTQQPITPLQKPPGYRNPGGVQLHHRPPPKPARLPPPFHRKRSCCRHFCCCICVSTAILLLAFVSAAAFFYLWFQPRLPEIHLKSIDFTKFHVSSAASADGPTLDAQSTLAIVIKNPNQNLGIEYDRGSVHLNAADVPGANLGEKTLPGFSQDKYNVTTLKFSMNVEDEAVDDQSAQDLKNGFKNKNLVLNAEIRSGIGIKVSGWSTGFFPVKVMCVGMKLNRVQSGDQMVKCRVELIIGFI